MPKHDEVPNGPCSNAMTRRQFGLAAAAAGAGLMLPAGSKALADAYPSRTVMIVAPAAAGGPTDTIGRAAAQRLTKVFNQNFIVENKPGASGNVAAQAVARAEADGYTLIVLLAPLAQNTAIYRNPGFHLQQDFKPLAHMASVDLVIAARKDLPVNNLDEFLAFLQKNPGKLSCGSQSPPQMKYLMQTTKVEFTVVPYKGSAPIANDLIAGQIDVGLVPYSDIAQHVDAGSVKVLFTNGPRRVRKLPNVQAVGEKFPGFYFWSWYGLAAPAHTPEPIVQRLRAELATIAKSPDFVAFVEKLGLSPVDEPEKFGDVIAGEISQWKRLVDELNLERM
ncbi:tripartite tricarboxylate transporter substrate binding protein [Pseudolabrys taiwanensis]|uniref:Tripartite tricarboxylate transporter substrate binding protein n=1 Tax=Pseudolabrys taiwanensis TaxID=331696 RepID=A0A346A0L2_9HYPH|nr:tripartite tricarboxylate transporter substrate binding protein [Pseudolabrys taiwanensis]AXK82709.1 tripartite tricarboxylate transporter substrate binding protein [Pseudolabrys taiwanensis]